jgi:PPOX class probable F420-dependent enzyme
MRTDITTFDSLASAQYACLTTFRRNGTAVPTPIWFAIYEPTGTMYIETGATSGKVKRIRHTQRVTLAQCTARGKVTGAVIEGKARIITDAEEIFIAKEALHSKYGLKRQVFYFVMHLIGSIRRAADLQHIYIAIEPSTK